jgi:hypothetical protein
MRVKAVGGLLLCQVGRVVRLVDTLLGGRADKAVLRLLNTKKWVWKQVQIQNLTKPNLQNTCLKPTLTSAKTAFKAVLTKKSGQR